MAVGHGAEERAVGICFREVLDALLAAGVEVGIRNVGAGGNGTLDDVEGRLEGRALDCRGHLQLCRNLVFRNLEHRELVGIEGDRTLRSGEAHADEIGAGHLLRLQELALRPVTHELQAGLVLDDHRRGEVPVAAGEVVVHIGAQLRHAVEGFLHLVAAERRRIEIDESLLVEVVAQRKNDGVEDRRVLPGLAAMGDRRDALLFELVEQRDQFFPGGRFLTAGLVEGGLVDPDPVGRMDVDRRGDPVSVIFRELLQCRRNDLVPALLGGDLVQIAERAFLGPVENVEAEHLHGRRRVARGDAGTKHRHRFGAAAAGDRHVGPADALALQVLLEDVEGRGFAAGRPPVQYFHILGCTRSCRRQHQCCNSSRRHELAHRYPPVCKFPKRNLLRSFPVPPVPADGWPATDVTRPIQDVTPFRRLRNLAPSLLQRGIHQLLRWPICMLSVFVSV